MSEYSKDENHGSVDNLSSLSVLAQTAAAHEQYAPHADATPANEVATQNNLKRPSAPVYNSLPQLATDSVDQAVLELVDLIGPTVAQLPPSDRTTACRRLVQFLEAEEAMLFNQPYLHMAQTAQIPMVSLQPQLQYQQQQHQQQQQQQLHQLQQRQQQQPQQQQQQQFLQPQHPFLQPQRPPLRSSSTGYAAAGMSVEWSMADPHMTSRSMPANDMSGRASTSSCSLSSPPSNLRPAEVLTSAPPPPSSSSANNGDQVESDRESDLPRQGGGSSPV